VIEEASSASKHHGVVFIENVAPYVAVVQLYIVLRFCLASIDLSFEIEVFARFAGGGNKCPAVNRFTLPLGNKRLEFVKKRLFRILVFTHCKAETARRATKALRGDGCVLWQA
jgi:hypothetical protein